jgi:hypothetical protein
MKVYRNYEINEIPLFQSWLVGNITDIKYNELVKILGEPTYNEPSEDNKTQVQWIVGFEGNLFDIYDWKTYNREFTLNELDHWHIGGNTDPNKLIEFINNL